MHLAHITIEGRGNIDRLIAGIVSGLEGRGLHLAGTVQTNIARAASHKCDMDLRLLPRGPVLRISEDRGAHARGCHLDTGALEQGVAWVMAHLDGADLLVINKFGRQEAEGKGLVPAIAEALSRDIPVLVGVNGLNLPAFQTFAGGLATALPADIAAAQDWCLRATGKLPEDARRLVQPI